MPLWEDQAVAVESGVSHIYTPLLLGFQGSFLRYKIPLFVMML